MVLAFCNSPHSPLSVYQVSLNYLKYFKRYALDKSVTDGWTDILLQTAVTSLKVVIELLFLYSALPLLVLYQYIKFHFIPLTFYTFRDMLWTSFILPKLKRGSSSVNTGDRVTVLVFCNSHHGPLSVYQVSLH